MHFASFRTNGPICHGYNRETEGEPVTIFRDDIDCLDCLELYETEEGARPYEILRQVNGVESSETYWASSVSEALSMAERDDAGKQDALYFVHYRHVADARAEGLRINDADGAVL